MFLLLTLGTDWHMESYTSYYESGNMYFRRMSVTCRGSILRLSLPLSSPHYRLPSPFPSLVLAVTLHRPLKSSCKDGVRSLSSPPVLPLRSKFNDFTRRLRIGLVLVTRQQELSSLYSTDISRGSRALQRCTEGQARGFLDPTTEFLPTTMTSTSPNKPRRFNKKVLVHAPDLGVFCIALLRVFHHETDQEGSISLLIEADLINQSNKSQVILNFPLNSIETCKLFPQSNDSLIPFDLIKEHPAYIPSWDASNITTMSLKLGSTGDILRPAGIDFSCLANSQDSDLHAFADICEAKHVHLHIAKRQFQGEELNDLKSLCSLLPKLGQKDFKSHHMVKEGLGVFRNLCNFPKSRPPDYAASMPTQTEQLDLPPYPQCEVPVSDQGGKRRRGIFLFFVF